ncbi:MAG: hydrogenase expression/formation protein HypE [Candidatus Cloacimonetes bacterium]|nr:hydrogenase expression/formation protein HypE [Candidatus Cloacimonadota bacterium]
MQNKKDREILLSHGSGGKASKDLLSMVYNILGDVVINRGEDSGLISTTEKSAMTTDSYVIDPIFFPGGDIGKLSIYGTVNDLAMVGAKPKFITVSLLLEEGFSFSSLEKILHSIKEAAKETGVKIAAGDTKVVSKGKLDKIFVNTAGVGKIIHAQDISSQNAQVGDDIIVSGDIGDHGTAIMAHRNKFESKLKSDCASVYPLVEKLIEANVEIHTLRDPTRGGLASILNEIAFSSRVDIELEETKIPIKNTVQGICDALGIDPLYMACEGRVVIVSPSSNTEKVLEILHKEASGKNAAHIGKVINKSQNPNLLLKTFIGSRRILPLLTREQTPRIC